MDDDMSEGLTLIKSFRTDKQQQIEHLHDQMAVLGLLVDTDSEELEIADATSGVTVSRGEATAGGWPSDTALVANVATFVTLNEQLRDWDERDVDGLECDREPARLRAFLKSYPRYIDCQAMKTSTST